MFPRRSQQPEPLLDDEEAHGGCPSEGPQQQTRSDGAVLRWSAWLLMAPVVLIILSLGKALPPPRGGTHLCSDRDFFQCPRGPCNCLPGTVCQQHAEGLTARPRVLAED